MSAQLHITNMEQQIASFDSITEGYARSFLRLLTEWLGTGEPYGVTQMRPLIFFMGANDRILAKTPVGKVVFPARGANIIPGIPYWCELEHPVGKSVAFAKPFMNYITSYQFWINMIAAKKINAIKELREMTPTSNPTPTNPDVIGLKEAKSYTEYIQSEFTDYLNHSVSLALISSRLVNIFERLQIKFSQFNPTPVRSSTATASTTSNGQTTMVAPNGARIVSKSGSDFVLRQQIQDLSRKVDVLTLDKVALETAKKNAERSYNQLQRTARMKDSELRDRERTIRDYRQTIADILDQAEQLKNQLQVQKSAANPQSMAPGINIWKIIGCDPQDDIERVKKAVTRAIMSYHEDRVANAGPLIQEYAKEISRQLISFRQAVINKQKQHS